MFLASGPSEAVRFAWLSMARTSLISSAKLNVHLQMLMAKQTWLGRITGCLQMSFSYRRIICWVIPSTTCRTDNGRSSLAAYVASLDAGRSLPGSKCTRTP
jgi:hypothetical protein